MRQLLTPRPATRSAPQDALLFLHAMAHAAKHPEAVVHCGAFHELHWRWQDIGDTLPHYKGAAGGIAWATESSRDTVRVL